MWGCSFYSAFGGSFLNGFSAFSGALSVHVLGFTPTHFLGTQVGR